MFAALRRYREAHGHCMVPGTPKQKSLASLGRWVGRVRRLNRAGRLLPAQKEALDSLHFEWNHDAGCWGHMLRLLVSFQRQHGHCMPPPSGTTRRLAHWVYAQRALRASGDLAEERIEQLNHIGFQWNAIGARWDQMFAKLEAHTKANGHCSFPWNDDSALARWTRAQRREHRRGRLSRERIEKLTRVGLQWHGVSPADRWQQRVAELKAFLKEHGHCNVPVNYASNRQLGLWVFHQRQFFKKGDISQERVAELDEMGFVWSVRAAAWDRNYAEMARYAAEHGKCSVSSDNRRLAAWAYDQRVARRNGRLSLDRIAKLDAIGFGW